MLPRVDMLLLGDPQQTVAEMEDKYTSYSPLVLGAILGWFPESRPVATPVLLMRGILFISVVTTFRDTV